MAIDLDERGKAMENEYFHRKEQEVIDKMKAKLAAENLEASALDCPKCDGKLVETDFENIKIDVCNACSGVWFDAGELAQVVGKEEEKGWFGRVFG